jgi:hypothetical protein
MENRGKHQAVSGRWKNVIKAVPDTHQQRHKLLKLEWNRMCNGMDWKLRIYGNGIRLDGQCAMENSSGMDW